MRNLCLPMILSTTPHRSSTISYPLLSYSRTAASFFWYTCSAAQSYPHRRVTSSAAAMSASAHPLRRNSSLTHMHETYAYSSAGAPPSHRPRAAMSSSRSTTTIAAAPPAARPPLEVAALARAVRPARRRGEAHGRLPRDGELRRHVLVALDAQLDDADDGSSARFFRGVAIERVPSPGLARLRGEGGGAGPASLGAALDGDERGEASAVEEGVLAVERDGDVRAEVLEQEAVHERRDGLEEGARLRVGDVRELVDRAVGHVERAVVRGEDARAGGGGARGGGA